MTLLLAQSYDVPAAEKTAQEQYLDIYLAYDHEYLFEQKDDQRQIYLHYSKILRRLISLRNTYPNFEPDMLNRRIKDSDTKLQELKTQIVQHPRPSPETLGPFIDNMNTDLENWKELQGKLSEWKSKLIANRISDDKSILAYLKQP